MYTVLPDGTVEAIGREEGEDHNLSLVEIAQRLQSIYQGFKLER